MDKKIIAKKIGDKIFINGKEIPGITDISKLPWIIRKFIDQDNNGKIDVIEQAEKEGLINFESFNNTQNPTNQTGQPDALKRSEMPQNSYINTSPNPNNNPILVPQDGVENKLRLLGLILFAGLVAFFIYKYFL